MIQIKIQKEKIIIKGHALYDDYGKDIVCAGVSSILTTTINATIRFNPQAISYQKRTDEFELWIKSNDKITKTLIENMISLYKELEETYPKNIKIESEEEK